MDGSDPRWRQIAQYHAAISYRPVEVSGTDRRHGAGFRGLARTSRAIPGNNNAPVLRQVQLAQRGRAFSADEFEEKEFVPERVTALTMAPALLPYSALKLLV